MTVETINWHTLHPRFLNERSKVLDLGANYGSFTRAITERFGCRCLAVEPSPVPFRSIQETSLIRKINCGVAGVRGKLRFKVDENELASAFRDDGTIEIGVVPLAELVEENGGVDLLKVDIEGSEVEMFDSCPDDVLISIGQISVEFHDFCGLTPVSQVNRIKQRLQTLGFESVRMSRIGHQDTWLINTRLLPISEIEIAYIRHIVRNVKGIARIASRLASKPVS